MGVKISECLHLICVFTANGLQISMSHTECHRVSFSRLCEMKPDTCSRLGEQTLTKHHRDIKIDFSRKKVLPATQDIREYLEF